MCEGETLCRALPDKPGEECGVFGMYDTTGADVASTIYYGLFALQHRGQESCGIAVSDTAGPRGQARFYKGMGLVNEVFTPDALQNLQGNLGVGHVRYSTAGSSTRENAQPLVLNYLKGTLAMAHNGNLINTPELRQELARTGAIFQTTIDSEVIAYLIARQRVETSSVEEAVVRAMQKLRGSYSLVIMSPRKLIGARDPFGFRPLCIGRRDNAWILASETCALETVGATFVRDVLPGEVVTITPQGIQSDTRMCLPAEKHARCVFEYIYFSRPDSHLDGMSVYRSRLLAGDSWPRTPLWRPIWWWACPSRATPPLWAILWNRGFPRCRPLSKTAMWAAPSSSPARTAGYPASGSS